MKKKYLFSLPIVSSLATLPFFISQNTSTTNSQNNSSSSSDQFINTLRDNIAKSSQRYSELSVALMNNIVGVLTRIQNNYKIQLQSIGLEYFYGNYAKLGQLNKDFNSLHRSKDQSSLTQLLTNNSEFIALQSDLASEYFAAQHLEELLKNADSDLRNQLVSNASKIYEKAKNDYKSLNSNALYPPIKLIVNAYENNAVNYLGEELTKAKKINEENQNKIKKDDSSTQTEETTSSTESTPVTNNPTGEVKT
ncbi:hypothetical protein, partial [Mycoplasmopsis meleagridis]